MSLRVSRWAAATAALLCLTACSAEEKEKEPEEAPPGPSPIVPEGPPPPCTRPGTWPHERCEPLPSVAQHPRGLEVRPVWVDSRGRAYGEYLTIEDKTWYSNPRFPSGYWMYWVDQGPSLDSDKRKWQVSRGGRRSFAVDAFFESSDCSGPGFLFRNQINGQPQLTRLEGSVVEPSGGPTLFVPRPGTGGPECATRNLGSLRTFSGECHPVPASYGTTGCGYALESLPEVPPESGPAVAPLHLEPRALPEDERQPCDTSTGFDVYSSPCQFRAPGSGFLALPGYSGTKIPFYIDDSHYLWTYGGSQTGPDWIRPIYRADTYYFTQPGCQGEPYLETPEDPHATMGLVREGGRVYARPPGRVSEPVTIASFIWVFDTGTMSSCNTPYQGTEPRPRLLPFSELLAIPPPLPPEQP